MNIKDIHFFQDKYKKSKNVFQKFWKYKDFLDEYKDLKKKCFSSEWI